MNMKLVLFVCLKLCEKVNITVMYNCYSILTQVYKDVISLKKQNPNLKVLLSVGGALESSGFSNLVRDPEAVER